MYYVQFTRAHVAAGFVLFCVMLLAGPAAASVILDDEAAFRSAAPTSILEDFEGLAVGESVLALATPGYAFGILSNGEYPVGYQQSSGGTTRSGVRTIVNSSNAAFPGQGPLVLVAETGVEFSAVGYWNTGGDDTTRLSAFDRAGNLLETAVSAFGETFLGFTDLTHASRIEISGETGNFWFSIDDLQIATANAGRDDGVVALPPTLPMLALGALGLVRRKWRMASQ